MVEEMVVEFIYIIQLNLVDCVVYSGSQLRSASSLSLCNTVLPQQLIRPPVVKNHKLRPRDALKITFSTSPCV